MYYFIQKIIVLSQHWSKEHFLINTSIIVGKGSLNSDDHKDFDNTKGVIGIRKSKKDRQRNGPKKGQQDKQRSTKHTHKAKDRVTRTLLKTGGEQFLLH
jgi:hypothetical protein